MRLQQAAAAACADQPAEAMQELYGAAFAGVALQADIERHAKTLRRARHPNPGMRLRRHAPTRPIRVFAGLHGIEAAKLDPPVQESRYRQLHPLREWRFFIAERRFQCRAGLGLNCWRRSREKWLAVHRARKLSCGPRLFQEDAGGWPGKDRRRKAVLGRRRQRAGQQQAAREHPRFGRAEHTSSSTSLRAAIRRGLLDRRPVLEQPKLAGKARNLREKEATFLDLPRLML